jgi:hypothetical protein
LVGTIDDAAVGGPSHDAVGSAQERIVGSIREWSQRVFRGVIPVGKAQKELAVVTPMPQVIGKARDEIPIDPWHGEGIASDVLTIPPIPRRCLEIELGMAEGLSSR